jgi:hypothetical protein
LPTRGFTDATVDKLSPVFDFHSGLSPFVAFELPRQAAPYRVRIKSVFDEKKSGADSVFYPVVALLDETFIVVQMTGIDNLRLEPALATPGGAAGLSVYLAIDPAEQKGKYLVVFTPAVLLGAPPEARREGDLLTPATLAWLERRGETVVPPSPYGNLKITVAPDQPLATAGAYALALASADELHDGSQHFAVGEDVAMPESGGGHELERGPHAGERLRLAVGNHRIVGVVHQQRRYA